MKYTLCQSELKGEGGFGDRDVDGRTLLNTSQRTGMPASALDLGGLGQEDTAAGSYEFVKELIAFVKCCDFLTSLVQLLKRDSVA